MQLNNISLRVLVKSRAIKEHVSPLDLQTYIEGREGSEFELEIRNDNAFDVEVIMSIDGLSITDGKPAGANSRGYIIGANKTSVIPGWKVDGQTAAKFTFSGAKGSSYVEQIGGDSLNKGVIGIKVYEPLHKPYRPVTTASHVKGLRSAMSATTFGSRSMGSPGLAGAAGPAGWSSLSVGSVQGTPTINNMMASNAMLASNHVATSFTTDDTADAAVEQTLGTEFGEATAFKTTQVSFTRGDLLVEMALYYDDAQGLRARGIDPRRNNTRPSAFPADTRVGETVGCNVPEGWSKEGRKANLIVTVQPDADPAKVADYIRLRGITVTQVLASINVINCEVQHKNANEAILRINDVAGVVGVSQEARIDTL